MNRRNKNKKRLLLDAIDICKKNNYGLKIYVRYGNDSGRIEGKVTNYDAFKRHVKNIDEDLRYANSVIEDFKIERKWNERKVGNR